jgi:protein TonB
MLMVKRSGSGRDSAEKTGAEADSKIPIALIMASRRFTVSFIAYPLPQASPDFLMTRIDYRLFAALALSLTLHLLPLLPNFDFGQNFRLTVATLNAELRPPPTAPAAPPLSLPEQPGPASQPAPKTARPALPKPADKSGTPAPKTWTQAVRDHLRKLDNAGQFYPADAIARGLEGEVLVLLIIDEAGKVSAARVEQGSGQPILDEAALRAVRSLQSLPADAPRQVVLPVRFRLR